VADVVSVGFAGFPDEAFTFYAGLAADNSREFWARHKTTYEQYVRTPMAELFAVLEPEFGPVKMFRPHRDIRFSKDKSPYKDHQGGHAGGGFYLQLDADGLMVAGGMYAPSPEQLARYRAAVDADSTGKALVGIVEKLSAEGCEIAGDRLKTRPRGASADHPRLELLRHRSLYAHQGWPADPWMHDGPEVIERVRDAWRRLRPLVGWGAEHVGGNEQLG
jgi:uncharacterized protein (TIGR02453 family)